MRIDASFLKGKERISVNLTLFSWNENNIFYIYSPALDLTGYGYTEDEARSSFAEILEQFVDYTHNKETIFDELERLGWTINKKKKRVKSPDIEDMLIDNDQFKEVINKSGVKKEDRVLELF